MTERSRMVRRGHRVDYKALNTLSTADLEVHLKGRKKYKSGSKTYLVDRLISRRKQNYEDFEYLVKWKNWPLWASTWEPSAHLSEQLIRAYSNPFVSVERLQSASASFLEGILLILKSNAVKVSYSTEIRMEHDIVRHTFKGKGTRAADGVSMLYEKGDFSRLELPPYWYYYLNELGQGIAVHFPVKLKPILTYSKKRYMSSRSQIKLAPNFPVEKVVIYVNRKACDFKNVE